MLVAHCSDLHLLSLQGVRPLDFLGKRVTGAVNLLLRRGGQFPLAVARALVDDLNRQPIDHLILSGDLTNLAFPAEFEVVRGLLEGLALPAERVTVVPGNHDVYTREAAAADHFGRIMAPFLRRRGPGRFPQLSVQDGLCVLALSSAVPSPPLLAIGELGATQLRAAEELLGGEACRGRFRVIVVHHPPEHPCAHWHNRLVDGGAFLAMLRRTGAELVVHGHLHRFSRLSLPGRDAPVPMLGVASGTWLSPHDPARRAQYNLYEIEGGQLVRVRRRRLEVSLGRFEELG